MFRLPLVLLPGLELATSVVGDVLAEMISGYQTGGTVGSFVSSTIMTAMNTLAEVGPGTCLPETDIALLDAALTSVPAG